MASTRIAQQLMLLLATTFIFLGASTRASFQGMSPDEVTACSQSLQKIPDCVAEAVAYALGQQIKLDDVCCKALEEIDEQCFDYLKSILPFNPLFPAPPLEQGLCSTGSPPGPSPGPVAAATGSNTAVPARKLGVSLFDRKGLQPQP